MKPHAAIPVTDTARSAAFYGRLGFRFIRSIDRPEWKLKIMFLEHSSGLSVELMEHPDNGSIKFPKVAEVMHIAIPVDNVRDLVSQLEGEGVVIARPVTPGITVRALAFIKDPDGFSVELYEDK